MPVYQYQGQHYDLPDGLSNEQAIAKIQTYLGEKQPEVSTPAVSESPSIAAELGRQLGLTARAGISGLSAVPNAVADFLSGAANLGLQAAGFEQRVPYLSQLQQEALNKTLPVPKPGLESAVQTGAEAIAGMMTPGMKVPMSQQAEAAAPREIARRAASEAASVAAGAIVGEEAAKKATELTGSPWAGLAAGLATGTIVGSGTGKALFSLTGPRQEATTIEQVRRRASQGYQTMADADISVKTNSINNKLVPTIEKTLADNNFSPEIVDTHRPIAQALKNAEKVLADPYISFDKLEKIRSSFSGMAAGTDDQARIAKAVVNDIDSYMANLSNKDVLALGGGNAQDALEALRKARVDWRNQARAQVIQDILDSSTARMEGSTGATGDIIKRNLVNLTANTEKMKMFSSREQNVIKAAAKATDIETLLALMSKFNPERGALQAAFTGGSLMRADTLQGQLGLGAAGAGYLSDKALTTMRTKEVQNLINQIASGNLQAPKEGFAIPGLFGATLGTTGR